MIYELAKGLALVMVRAPHRFSLKSSKALRQLGFSLDLLLSPLSGSI